MKNKIIYVLIFVLAAAFLSGCGKDSAAAEKAAVTELLGKWAAPQSKEVIADFYDGWTVIGEDTDSTETEDNDEALDTAYRKYFTDEGWTYFHSFLLPITIAATENDYTLSAENITVEELTDGYDVTFDLKHYKGEDKDKTATVNSLSFRCYFKEDKICRIDFPDGMISPQFFADKM